MNALASSSLPINVNSQDDIAPWVLHYTRYLAQDFKVSFFAHYSKILFDRLQKAGVYWYSPALKILGNKCMVNSLMTEAVII